MVKVINFQISSSTAGPIDTSQDSPAVDNDFLFHFQLYNRPIKITNELLSVVNFMTAGNYGIILTSGNRYKPKERDVRIIMENHASLAVKDFLLLIPIHGPPVMEKRPAAVSSQWSDNPISRWTSVHLLSAVQRSTFPFPFVHHHSCTAVKGLEKSFLWLLLSLDS